MVLLITLTQTAFAIIAVLLLYFCLKKTKRDPRYPPGPKSIPLLGNVLQLGKDPFGKLQKWAEKYGPIFSLKMGTQDTIVISDPKLVKELYSDINSTGRAANAVTNYFGNGYGIVQAQDHVWESQRRFTLRKLRDVGVLKSSIEGFIMEETATLVNFFNEHVGKPIPGIRLYNGPVVTALWRTISGESIDWVALEKPAMLKGVESLVDSLNKTASSGLFFASFLRHIAPGFFGWTDWVNSVNNFLF
ncbi:Farnesoate epoxidase [Orchesella cincta]|uniref:Farnesoate epoxidase n=1 Tax=Orchesella cincta TaxID=48709 RepID=A0A1D2M8M4_ORCCI|nr:Farnesoate epoxidase [Orchesella cincta]